MALAGPRGLHDLGIFDRESGTPRVLITPGGQPIGHFGIDPRPARHTRIVFSSHDFALGALRTCTRWCFRSPNQASSIHHSDIGSHRQSVLAGSIATDDPQSRCLEGARSPAAIAAHPAAIPSAVSEPRDYENGVADVLAYLLPGASVSRNVRLPGQLSETQRQVDVLIRSVSDGEASKTLIVDCKRWSSKIDVADVGTFIDLVKDVGARAGLLITTSGASNAAFTRARNADRLRIDIMPLDELKSWRPVGTVFVVYRIDVDRQEHAERVLRNAGFRTIPTAGYECDDGRFLLEAFRHYGVKAPDGIVQSAGFEICERALDEEMFYVA